MNAFPGSTHRQKLQGPNIIPFSFQKFIQDTNSQPELLLQVLPALSPVLTPALLGHCELIKKCFVCVCFPFSRLWSHITNGLQDAAVERAQLAHGATGVCAESPRKVQRRSKTGVNYKKKSFKTVNYFPLIKVKVESMRLQKPSSYSCVPTSPEVQDQS